MLFPNPYMLGAVFSGASKLLNKEVSLDEEKAAKAVELLDKLESKAKELEQIDFHKPTSMVQPALRMFKKYIKDVSDQKPETVEVKVDEDQLIVKYLEKFFKAGRIYESNLPDTEGLIRGESPYCWDMPYDWCINEMEEVYKDFDVPKDYAGLKEMVGAIPDISDDLSLDFLVEIEKVYQDNYSWDDEEEEPEWLAGSISDEIKHCRYVYMNYPIVIECNTKRLGRKEERVLMATLSFNRIYDFKTKQIVWEGASYKKGHDLWLIYPQGFPEEADFVEEDKRCKRGQEVHISDGHYERKISCSLLWERTPIRHFIFKRDSGGLSEINQSGMDYIYSEGLVKTPKLKKYLSAMQDMYEKDGCYKLLIDGRPGLGKSCLLKLFVEDDKKRVAFLNVENWDSSAFRSWLHFWQPNVIIIDDIDKIDQQWLVGSGSLSMFESSLAEHYGVKMILMTSNRFTKIPVSLRRPGRIDAIMKFNPPTGDQAKKSIKMLSKKLTDLEFAEEDYEYMSQIFIAYGFAGLKEIINRFEVWGTDYRPTDDDLTFTLVGKSEEEIQEFYEQENI